MKKSKINLLFVVSQLEAGGSERIVLDLARGLNPNQYEIFVAAFTGGVLEDPMKKVCNKIFLIKKKYGLDIPAMFQLAKIIREHDIGVVNAHHYMPFFYSFFGTRILNRKQLIYTEHSVPEVDGVANTLHGRILKLMLFQLKNVVGVSHEITLQLKKYYPWHSNKFITILNGVDIERFQKFNNRSKVRSRWGLSDDHFVIGVVANFRIVKNHTCLIRAAARLKNTLPQLRLLFVGTGFPGDKDNSEIEIRKLTFNLGLHSNVILTGYQKNIPEILSALDVFCLPSLSEGLPISVLEAMASNVPVIGSKVRGIVEVVEDNVTGLLFPSNDDIMLAEKIKMLMSNSGLRKKMALQALSFVKTNHSMQNWVKTYADLFSA